MLQWKLLLCLSDGSMESYRLYRSHGLLRRQAPKLPNNAPALQCGQESHSCPRMSDFGEAVCKQYSAIFRCFIQTPFALVNGTQASSFVTNWFSTMYSTALQAQHAVAVQLQQHLDGRGLMESHQGQVPYEAFA